MEVERQWKYLAEFLGTALLVFFAVGSACFGKAELGALGIGLVFGLTLYGLAYAFTPISGCHVNPAVTVAQLVVGRISVPDAVGYIVAQVLGGIAGAALIHAVAGAGGIALQVQGANGYGHPKYVGAGGAFVLEIILTFMLVFVVFRATGPSAGAAIGLTLGVVNLVGIPLDGASANPARSIGPALWDGSHAIGQLWLFIIAPLIGGILAALVARLFAPVVDPYAPAAGD
ncbi:MIP/aquaporin family protein [Actinomadura macrotermitis]|uniref:Aquaporin Z 2 n=1 Tax=Actinomadura macrotermitis TaxID=2585200 RepID=A0A7K0C106_9ACTN|nr:aquaporin [Actinomadura macrotermitis]MQY07153.1 Aquaporin Z 2 [Actinomadura macrotermitis]